MLIGAMLQARFRSMHMAIARAVFVGVNPCVSNLQR